MASIVHDAVEVVVKPEVGRDPEFHGWTLKNTGLDLDNADTRSLRHLVTNRRQRR
jgi:hypothetical protein